MSIAERVRSRVNDSPRAFSTLHRHDPLAVNRDTELTIEGFPRSGNTFAVLALRQAQDRKLRLAHHRHSVGQVAQTVRLSVPGLILIRQPDRAVASLLVREPRISTADALNRYLRFYRAVEQRLDHLVIVRFDTMQNNFGAAIEAVNARFDLDLKTFEHTADNVAKVFEMIDSVNEQTGDAGARRSGRPDPHRNIELAARMAEIQAHRRLPACEAIYRRLQDRTV